MGQNFIMERRENWRERFHFKATNTPNMGKPAIFANVYYGSKFIPVTLIYLIRGSVQKHTHNDVHHLRWSLFAKMVKEWKPYTILGQLHLRYLTSFWRCLWWLIGFVKNMRRRGIFRTQSNICHGASLRK